MDSQAREGVDIVHDIEVIPWPIEPGSFDIIIAWHVIEHIKPWLIINVMDECWRVLRQGGTIEIAMPTPNSFGFYMDPTHVHTWNEMTPTYFDPDFLHYKLYQPKPWKVTHRGTYKKIPPKTAYDRTIYLAWKFILEKR